jgi:hypothetical protein
MSEPQMLSLWFKFTEKIRELDFSEYIFVLNYVDYKSSLIIISKIVRQNIIFQQILHRINVGVM